MIHQRFAALFVLTLAGATSSAVAQDAPAERRLKFTTVIEVEAPAGASQVEVWVPVASDLAGQEVLGFEVDSPLGGELTTDARGNQTWHLAVEAPSDEPVRVELVVELVRAQRGSAPAPDDAPASWLVPARLVPVGGRFAEIATAETDGLEGTPVRARALYDYVMDAMRYDKSGEGWGRGDSAFACDAGRGNCTDYHSLFLSLARSVGIPSRFCIGFPLPADGQGELGGYHCWAEYFDPDLGWVPVDISEADKNPARTEFFFGQLDANRVTLSRGRDLVLEPAQQGEPLNYFVQPYVEVDGQPWDQARIRHAYQDVR